MAPHLPRELDEGMDGKKQEEIFNSWMEAHQAIPIKVARCHERNPEDRADLVQNILLQIWLSIPSFDERCSLSTWIYRVALNTAFRWRRTESRRSIGLMRYEMHHEWSGRDTPSDLELEELYSAIRKLEQTDAAIIMMHLDGMSYREISEVMGMSEKGVGVRLSRARRKLANLLGG
ncbi:MAG: RNA polymerase sigma factor [Candidatus Sumerlaeia bacterium]|nr:RNA polymerase sigma factor [Candidatus Sumerlaeia bacterium]